MHKKSLSRAKPHALSAHNPLSFGAGSGLESLARCCAPVLAYCSALRDSARPGQKDERSEALTAALIRTERERLGAQYTSDTAEREIVSLIEMGVFLEGLKAVG